MFHKIYISVNLATVCAALCKRLTKVDSLSSYGVEVDLTKMMKRNSFIGSSSFVRSADRPTKRTNIRTIYKKLENIM